jgi:hypothetical protein
MFANPRRIQDPVTQMQVAKIDIHKFLASHEVALDIMHPTLHFPLMPRSVRDGWADQKTIIPDLLTFAIFRLFQAQKSSFQDTNGLLAGIKGYVTNLDIPDDQVITYYHQLFQIEATFRMAKSDMRARPIYHQNREAIEAHLTIVLTALAISRNIERKTGISIKQFVKLLRPIRSGIVTFNGKELLAEAEVPETTLVVLDRLPSGH